jgi:hypothetical protein
MLSNSGKPWTRGEEQDLVMHLRQYKGHLDRVAEAHQRSRAAIEIRIGMLAHRLIDLHDQPRHTVAKELSLDDVTLERLLQVQPPSSREKIEHRSHRDDTRTHEEMKEVMTRLEEIERLVRRVLKHVSPPKHPLKEKI